MQGARRWAWLIPRPSRATPQTPLAEPTRRDRTDLPSFVVVASLLGIDPTASAPPRLKANNVLGKATRITQTGSFETVVWAARNRANAAPPTTRRSPLRAPS